MTIRAVIESEIQDYILTRPRTLQAAIGPSELGIECDRHLAHRLAGRKVQDPDAWLPLIGSSVHHTIEQALGLDWMTEHRVTVGMVGNQMVSGNLDAYHVPSRTIVDFKIVGQSTLTQVRRSGPSFQYVTQIMLYAKGMADAGHDVERVAIAFLPRNTPTLAASVYWETAPDIRAARSALLRAERMWHLVKRMDEQWLDEIPATPGCWDCKREKLPVPPGTLADLIGA